jgi:hypothetical protein
VLFSLAGAAIARPGIAQWHNRIPVPAPKIALEIGLPAQVSLQNTRTFQQMIAQGHAAIARRDGELKLPIGHHRARRFNSGETNLSQKSFLCGEMKSFGEDKIARLLRLKRYEQPPPSYFENFLHEFRLVRHRALGSKGNLAVVI